MSEWISVKEQLPAVARKVLIAEATGRVTQAELQAYLTAGVLGSWYWHGADGSCLGLDAVTHWMPMPDPPRREASLP
jgi:Protein of unknown function (DUF551)